MRTENGAAGDCAFFAIMMSGYAGSVGAAKKCLECKEMPENAREDIWQKLVKWAGKKVLDNVRQTPSIHQALWDIGEKGMGFTVCIRDILLEQEAVEICEILGLNIYDLESADMELSLFSHPFPQDMKCIGYASKGNDKILVNGEDRSYLNKP